MQKIYVIFYDDVAPNHKKQNLFFKVRITKQQKLPG